MKPTNENHGRRPPCVPLAATTPAERSTFRGHFFSQPKQIDGRTVHTVQHSITLHTVCYSGSRSTALALCRHLNRNKGR